MKKARSMTITLPIERGAQLRAIALAHSLSVTELIRKFIETEIIAGVITDDIPGYRIRAINGCIEFELPGRALTLTKKEADQIAGAFETGGSTWCLELEYAPFLLEIGPRGRGLVIKLIEYKIFRRSRGPRYEAPWFRKGLSQTTANNLARQFRVALQH